MDIPISALDKAKECIKTNESFVMQGGAGSGKTETLKELLQFLSANYPDKKVACITHTNLAVDEIKIRYGEGFLISTIHSFLHSLIKDYKKNIKDVISDIFIISHMEMNPLVEGEDEREYKKNEHEKYKKAFEKYSDRIFTVKNIKPEKPVGKREYDKSPQLFNDSLNKLIDELNLEIKQIISEKDYNKIIYNETKFNNFNELSYGHDGLIDIAFLLFKRYEVLGKILQDKYNCVFIDEYQDTHVKVIDIFLNILPVKQGAIIGLFGDSMQAIYSDGIGDVEKYIKLNQIKEISKEDNYRCSEQVLTFINTLRIDSISQKVAFKTKIDGQLETLVDRQGSVRVIYALCDNKPNSRSSEEEKTAYIEKLDRLIQLSKEDNIKYKTLLLANKAVAKKVGFEKLYEVFDKRYIEANEYIDRHLTALQVIDLCDLCDNYENKKYNNIIGSIKKVGFVIKKASDKVLLKEVINKISNEELGLIEAVELAFKLKLLKKSDSFIQNINRKNVFLEQLKDDEEYQSFKKLFETGINTFTRMLTVNSSLLEEQFDDQKKKYSKEVFYNQLFSSQIKFLEAKKYFNYINEKEDHVTMHKTKGSGIEHVLVVLDEYFWAEYDFSLLYNDDLSKQIKRKKTQKLFYVACSRAKIDLTCVSLIKSDEESIFKAYFKSAIKVEV